MSRVNVRFRSRVPKKPRAQADLHILRPEQPLADPTRMSAPQPLTRRIAHGFHISIGFADGGL